MTSQDKNNGDAVLQMHRPLYQQIYQRLRAGILDGGYAALSRIPSESELVETYGVSRITVRQALNDLQKEGLIFKVHGKGSFVSRPKAFQNISTLQGFGESMSALGHEVVNRLVGLKFAPPEAEVAQRLGLAPGEVAAEIRRVRLLDREPVSLEITHLPEPLGRRLAAADLISRDIFLILENDCGVALGHAELAIDAVLADAALAQSLGLSEGAPVLRIERLTHDAAGRPIDFEYLYFRADTFQYRLRVDRHKNAAPARREE